MKHNRLAWAKYHQEAGAAWMRSYWYSMTMLSDNPEYFIVHAVFCLKQAAQNYHTARQIMGVK